jgi:phage terminase large subunit-like protein
MRAGPKADVKVPPLDLDSLPENRADRRIAFVHKYLKVPRGYGIGTPMRLRDWQQTIVRGALAPHVRSGLVALPRGNGKSSLAAALCCAELFCERAASVAVVASNENQASIVLGIAKSMIAASPELSERVQVFSDRIVSPLNGGEFVALPARAAGLHGLDLSWAIVDELHAVDRAVYEAILTGSGKRPESCVLAISTPAASADSLMWDLVKHGRRQDDPAFYFTEYSAPAGCATDDRAAWFQANPALDDFLSLDSMEAVRRITREPVFRALRLGQWVADADLSWLPWGSWAACAAPERVIPDRTRVTLGFDGSASGDSTALIACTIPIDGEAPHISTLNIWANPGDRGWRVPRGEVAAAVASAFERFDVRELAADPWGWRSELESWGLRWPSRVIEYPSNIIPRMAPATDRLYAAITNRAVTHDGDSRLAAHVAHCVAKSTTHGDVIVKDKPNSPRKIDAAVAAIIAFDRAAYYARKPVKRSRVLVK